MLLSPRAAQGCVRTLALAAAAATALACGAGGDDSFKDSKPITVETERVTAELLRDLATFSGQLSPEHSVMLKPETAGVIQEILFEEGQEVGESQVLFRLRSREQAALLREAQANLALKLEVYNRVQKLERRDAASTAAKDEAAAELAAARARVDLAKVELDRTDIVAPFDGVLDMRLVSVGDRVDDDTRLVKIDAVDRLQVIYAITELGILFTRVGTPVEVRVGPYPGEIFPGKVFFVSPTLDPSTRRIIAKAWVDNEDRRLRAGLFATIDMEVDRREGAILVSESAVVFDQRGSYVWKLLEDGTATRVPIETGLRRDGKVEITLGLQPGDTIVSAGVHKVEAGKKLVAAAPDPASKGQAAREVPAVAGEGT
jgi:membrane fusion protein (multidrug efflux system)